MEIKVICRELEDGLVPELVSFRVGGVLRFFVIPLLPALVMLVFGGWSFVLLSDYLEKKQEGKLFARESVTTKAAVLPSTGPEQYSRSIYAIQFDMYAAKFRSKRHTGPRDSIAIRYRTIVPPEDLHRRVEHTTLIPGEGRVQIVDDVEGFTWRNHYRQFYGEPGEDLKKAVVICLVTPVFFIVAIGLRRKFLEALRSGRLSRSGKSRF